MNIISSNNLKYQYKYYNEEGQAEYLEALKGININVEKGNFVAILGHNGSGKSTFAKHINGILISDAGSINVHGIEISPDFDSTWEVRKQTGMVFQNPDNQIVATIVEDDVAFGVENLGVESLEIRKRVDEALKWTGMYDYKDISPSQLSGGQKQRVAIAGILAMRPKLIVLDEPTAMLDPVGRREVMEAVIKLNREENITIVLITHYMEEAALADKVVVMEDGVVVDYGTPKEIFSKVELLKKIGLDVPEVTEIAYNLNKKGVNISKDILSIEEMVGAICQLK